MHAITPQSKSQATRDADPREAYHSVGERLAGASTARCRLKLSVPFLSFSRAVCWSVCSLSFPNMSRGPGAGSLEGSTAPSSDVDVALDGNLRHLSSQHRPPNLARTQAIAPKSQQLSREIPPALPKMSSGPESNLMTPAGEHHRRSKSWTAPAPQSEGFAQSHGLPSTTQRSRYVLPAIPASPSQVHWKAIRDHPSEFPGELSLTKDEVIIISKKFDNCK